MCVLYQNSYQNYIRIPYESNVCFMSELVSKFLTYSFENCYKNVKGSCKGIQVNSSELLGMIWTNTFTAAKIGHGKENNLIC